MDQAAELRTVFSKNRAEELGYDVSEHFVVPPFLARLELGSSQKPRVIFGGRGCGKTMLLRYLSHHTAFSQRRMQIPISAVDHIGLYWRTDTQFTNAMYGRGVPDDVWASAFNHMAALMLSLELLSSIRNIAASAYSGLCEGDLALINLSRLTAFDPTLPADVSSMHEVLESRLWALEGWVNNVRKAPEPVFLPGVQFVSATLQLIQEQLRSLSGSTFYVYIDEYENLPLYQKRIVNTWLKHSASPLIFNLAMKRNGFDTRETTGPESLSSIHDYRDHDLEGYIIESEFRVFAAEILFLQLSQTHLGLPPVEPELLRDPARISERRSSTYRTSVLDSAKRLFPDPSSDELAGIALADNGLKRILLARIETALGKKSERLSVEAFYDERFPRATVIMPALLQRRSLTPKAILSEFEAYKGGHPSKFNDWVHNNFIGCLLQLYAPESRPCPFYAGFETFCKLAHGNIRHFLELCHKSIYRAVDRGQSGVTVNPVLQAEAARQASTAFLGEIRSFGRLGNQLYTFILRLGSLFSLAHLRPTQSETEQNHFAITQGALSDNDHEFLLEATKWSVLFEQTGTKKKQDYEPETMDYVLAPIYAPYFHISYRKKRKCELTADEFRILAQGSVEDVSALFRGYKRQWGIEDAADLPPLFKSLYMAGSLGS
jgi:hypothetical protein